MNLYIMARWIALSVLMVGLAACTTPIPPSPTPTAFASAHRAESPTIVANDDNALQLESDDAAAYHNRGIAYASKGDYDRAIADYDKAIQLQPDNALVYLNRGRTHKANGARESAIADFKKVLDLTNDQYIRQQAEEQLKALGVQ